MDDNSRILDLITVLSLILGVENYKLNDQQVDMMMREMSQTQDVILKKKIIEQNEIIIQQNEELKALLSDIKII